MQRNDRLGMRVKPADKARWRETAEAEGLSLSAWVEKSLNETASPQGDLAARQVEVEADTGTGAVPEPNDDNPAWG